MKTNIETPNADISAVKITARNGYAVCRNESEFLSTMARTVLYKDKLTMAERKTLQALFARMRAADVTIESIKWPAPTPAPAPGEYTFAEAKRIIWELGFTIKIAFGDYIVRGKGNEYHTNCLKDAVATAKAMDERAQRDFTSAS